VRADATLAQDAGDTASPLVSPDIHLQLPAGASPAGDQLRRALLEPVRRGAVLSCLAIPDAVPATARAPTRNARHRPRRAAGRHWLPCGRLRPAGALHAAVLLA